MKIKSLGKAGLSRIEFICIIILIVVAIGFAIVGVMYYQNDMSLGDDAMKAKTCERVARVNLLDNGCVVSNCDRKKRTCSHQFNNKTIGYWDAVAKKVYADKPSGYNEHKKMKIGDTIYRGQINTMVIKVEGHGDEVFLSWVKGME